MESNPMKLMESNPMTQIMESNPMKLKESNLMRLMESSPKEKCGVKPNTEPAGAKLQSDWSHTPQRRMVWGLCIEYDLFCHTSCLCNAEVMLAETSLILTSPTLHFLANSFKIHGPQSSKIS